jgi:hypothetical protein
MDASFTQPPWSSDLAGRIDAENGRPAPTTVATWLPGARPKVLAAAPDLLSALVNSMECLEQEFDSLPSGARLLAVLDARNCANTAIAHATIGRADLYTPPVERLWTVNPRLPAAERKANEQLLDAAYELLEAATRVFGALSTYVDNPKIVGALRDAIARTM